jgi:hypothetical protein
MSPTTELIREQAVLALESDVPAGMTLGEYRRSRVPAPTRWERARPGLLGLGLVGLLVETLHAQRGAK